MRGIFLTCAVTGNHTTREQHPRLPVSPSEIAEASLEAAAAGAAAVHIHVRDPATGRPSMEVELYADVVAQIRRSDSLLVINLTTGPGGRFQPSDHDPLIPGPRTNLLSPERRVEHIQALCLDIATLDLNTMTFGGEVVINTPGQRAAHGGSHVPNWGPGSSSSCLDSGDVLLLRDLIADVGTVAGSSALLAGAWVLIRLSADHRSIALCAFVVTRWTLFGLVSAWVNPLFRCLRNPALSRGQRADRTGRDCVYLSKGQLTPSNAALVAKAKQHS